LEPSAPTHDPADILRRIQTSGAVERAHGAEFGAEHLLQAARLDRMVGSPLLSLASVALSRVTCRFTPSSKRVTMVRTAKPERQRPVDERRELRVGQPPDHGDRQAGHPPKRP
jgi:hypothetical protein